MTEHPQQQQPTDIEEFAACWAEIPLDPSKWSALASRVNALYTKVAHMKNDGGLSPAATGDGTITGHNLTHLRNLSRSLIELAWVISAIERGDDPDIPF